MVVGDGHGVVGFGVGKAKEVPSAIKKGIEGGEEVADSRAVAGDDAAAPGARALRRRAGAAQPAPDGTGIIAGGAVRAVVEAAGIENVLTSRSGRPTRTTSSAPRFRASAS